MSNVYAVSSFPSLNNSGDDVQIVGPNGIQIDKVSYTDDWYMDENKQTGGYSLELINLNDPCSDMSNWSASNSETGGTPELKIPFMIITQTRMRLISHRQLHCLQIFGNLFQRGNGLHIISKCIY